MACLLTGRMESAMRISTVKSCYRERRQRTLILLQGGNCRAVARIPVCTRTLSPLFLVAFFSTFSIIWFRGEGPRVEALGQDWAGDGHPPSRHLDDCDNLLELLPNLHDLRT
jgi:hypothetical protein